MSGMDQRSESETERSSASLPAEDVWIKTAHDDDRETGWRGANELTLTRGGSSVVDLLRAEIPDRVGPYLLGPMVGRGAMSVVCEALDVSRGEHLALKIAPLECPEAVAAVVSEAEALGRLDHPNIVRVKGLGRDARFMWIATELIDGRSLAEIIKERNNPLEEGEVLVLGDDDSQITTAGLGSGNEAGALLTSEDLRKFMGWFRDLADALATMHEAGLIHRDISPKNIMISRKGVPYLIDFGLSLESTNNSGELGRLSGTVPYMSPEQTLGGFVSLTPRSDIYSLAITFLEVLAGRRIVSGSGRESLLQEIAFGRLPRASRIIPGLPRALDPIFEKALARHPRDRYARASDLAADIEAWVESEPPRRPGERASSKLPRDPR